MKDWAAPISWFCFPLLSCHQLLWTSVHRFASKFQHWPKSPRIFPLGSPRPRPESTLKEKSLLWHIPRCVPWLQPVKLRLMYHIFPPPASSLSALVFFGRGRSDVLQFGAIRHNDCRTWHSAEPGMVLGAGLVGIEDMQFWWWFWVLTEKWISGFLTCRAFLRAGALG